jgi:hypothetical protein
MLRIEGVKGMAWNRQGFFPLFPDKPVGYSTRLAIGVSLVAGDATCFSERSK